MWGADEQVMSMGGIGISSVLHTIDLITLSVTLGQPQKLDTRARTLPSPVKPSGGLESTILEVSGGRGEVVLLQVLLRARMCVSSACVATH